MTSLFTASVITILFWDISQCEYKDTCPFDYYHGCSELNKCRSCDISCGEYCQNTEEDNCDESKCMNCKYEWCPNRLNKWGEIGDECYDLVSINKDGSGYCQHWKDIELFTNKYESNGDILPYSLLDEYNQTYLDLIEAYPYIQFIYDSHVFVIGAKSQESTTHNQQFIWIGNLNQNITTPSPTLSVDSKCVPINPNNYCNFCDSGNSVEWNQGHCEYYAEYYDQLDPDTLDEFDECVNELCNTFNTNNATSNPTPMQSNPSPTMSVDTECTPIISGNYCDFCNNGNSIEWSEQDCTWINQQNQNTFDEIDQCLYGLCHNRHIGTTTSEPISTSVSTTFTLGTNTTTCTPFTELYCLICDGTEIQFGQDYCEYVVQENIANLDAIDRCVREYCTTLSSGTTSSPSNTTPTGSVGSTSTSSPITTGSWQNDCIPWDTDFYCNICNNVALEWDYGNDCLWLQQQNPGSDDSYDQCIREWCDELVLISTPSPISRRRLFKSTSPGYIYYNWTDYYSTNNGQSRCDTCDSSCKSCEVATYEIYRRRMQVQDCDNSDPTFCDAGIPLIFCVWLNDPNYWPHCCEIDYCNNNGVKNNGNGTQINCGPATCSSCKDGFQLQKTNENDTIGYCIAIETELQTIFPTQFKSHKIDNDTLNHSFKCKSQCHTQPVFGDQQADVIYILNNIYCNYDYDPGNETYGWLFAFYPGDLLNDGNIHFEKYNLREYLCDTSILPDIENYDNEYIHSTDSYRVSSHEYDYQCITYHPDDDWLYIIVMNRILKWNVNTKDATWTDVILDEDIDLRNVPRGCTIDSQMQYLWITDSDGSLIVYDIEEDEVIDINEYNSEDQSFDSEDITDKTEIEYIHRYGDKIRYPKMIPLNDDFIFISSFDDYYVLYSGSEAKSDYGDIVCRGEPYQHFHTFSTPMFKESVEGTFNSAILWFGGFIGDLDILPCDPLTNATCISQFEKEISNHVESWKLVSYYSWQRDFKINFRVFPEQVVIGSNFTILAEFEPICDLSYYHDGEKFQVDLSDANPFTIEALVTSANENYGIVSYMYLINATQKARAKADLSTETYWTSDVCLLCDHIAALELDSFLDIDESNPDCKLCEDGFETNRNEYFSDDTTYNIRIQITRYSAPFNIPINNILTNPVIRTFTVISSYNTGYAKSFNILEEYGEIGAGGLAGIVVIIIIMVWIWNKKKALRLKARTMFIQNPMVLMIGIGVYDRYPKEREVTGILRDLDDGVKLDIYQTINLFHDSLNYEIFPEYDTSKENKIKKVYKQHWEKQELIDFVESKALKLRDGDYDGLLTIITCHGLQDRIITSDYKTILKLRLHRIFSRHAENRKIPRVFLFDCCSGDREREVDARWQLERKSDTDSSDEEEEEQEIGKNGTGVKAKYRQSVIWARDENNPDFLLATIDAANQGFQSKLDREKGSYFISTFIHKVSHNYYQESNKKFLMDITDEIQDELHSTGKQLVSPQYFNKTNNIKFLPNENPAKDMAKSEMKVETEEDQTTEQEPTTGIDIAMTTINTKDAVENDTYTAVQTDVQGVEIEGDEKEESEKMSKTEENKLLDLVDDIEVSMEALEYMVSTKL